MFHTNTLSIEVLAARLQKLMGIPIVRRFQKFLLVGLFNMAFSYLLYAVFLIVTPWGPQRSLLISFWLGVVWNYFGTARFVFDELGIGRFPAYLMCYLVVYLINAQALRLSIAAHVKPLLAQALLMPFAAVLTFTLVSIVLSYGRGEQSQGSSQR